jgi:DNA (cytosine-5)-methyltransferase 1
MLDFVDVDLFAGGGGASVGSEAALGKAPDFALNHDPVAIDVHEANHPGTTHLRCDVWEPEPANLCAGRRLRHLHASPDCKDHSRAKGGKPKDQRIRSLAWVVVAWARRVKPQVITVENVPEFVDWGPLHAPGTVIDGVDVGDRRIESRTGETFRRWVRHLEGLGYQVDWRKLSACDYGAPTSRTRLFVVARCDGRPIVWPEPTHGPGRAHPYRTAAECVDWSIPVPSIYGRKRPLAAKTQARLAAGIRRFVLDAAEPFVVTVDRQSSTTPQDRHACVPPNRGRDVRAFLAAYYGSEDNGQPLDVPLRTVTTRDRFGLVTVDVVNRTVTDIGLRMLAPHELLRGQFGRFAARYDLRRAKTKTDQVRLIGNSVCPELQEAIVAAQFPEEAARARAA